MLRDNTISFIDTIEAMQLNSKHGEGIHELLCLVEACKLQLKDDIFNGHDELF